MTTMRTVNADWRTVWMDMDGWLPDRDVDVIAWDIDSTLFDTTQRHWMIPYIRKGERTWKDYAMARAADVPFAGAVALCQLLAPFARQVGVSNGADCSQGLLEANLRKYNVPLDQVFLKPDGDDSPGWLFKAGKLRMLESEGYIVRLVVEDDPQTAAFIRNHTGFPVLTVNPCYPEGVSDTVSWYAEVS